MIVDHIKTGDRVEITFGTEGSERTVLLSKVEVVLDKKKILIHAPIYKGRTIKLPKERTFTMLFISGSAMYRFDTEVDDYLKVDEFNVISIKLLTEGEKVQRREFFRFNCAIPVTFTQINENGEQVGAGFEEGIIRDISGGGMKLVATQDRELKSIIRATIQLDGEYLMLFGQILHKKHNPLATHPWQFSVKFAAISNNEQERIIQYVYNEQRKSLLRSK